MANLHLEEMQEVDLRTVDKNVLVDMSGFVFDNGLPRNQRASQLLKKVKNPYCFRVGEVCVKLEFSDNAPPLQECLIDFMHRKKSGI